MQVRQLAGLVGLALLAVATVACSPRGADDASSTAAPGASETPSGTLIPTATPEPGQTASPPPPLPEALQQVMERVAEIRGLAPLPGLHAELVARPDLPALLDTLLTDDDRKLMAEVTTLYRLLGHFRQDQDYLSIYQSFGADSILGLYSPAHDTLWVVYDGEEPTFDSLSASEEETLAHEFVHALQDYHFDLDGTYDEVGDQMDRGLAWTAVVEGDAVVHEAEYTDRYLAVVGAGRAFSFGILPQVPDVPLSFIRELLFPYTTGANWVDSLVRSEGVAYVNQLLLEPPAGTICVFHLERCLAGFEPVDIQLPDISRVLGPAWRHESGGTLGEFHLGNFLDLELRLSDALDAADGWVGDRYDVYVAGDESAAVFLLEFSSGDELREFSGALSELVEGQGGDWRGSEPRQAETADGREFVVASLEANRVLIAIGSAAGVGEAAYAAVHEGTP
jgi:hypothetical protein